MTCQFLIHLYDGTATVLDGNGSDARNFISEHGQSWEDWPEDLGCYDQGDGFLILEVEIDEDYKNPKWSRMDEKQFHLMQAYGSIWFE